MQTVLEDGKENKYDNDAIRNRIRIKAEQIAEVDIKIPNELLSIILLGSLPTEYGKFIIAMKSRDEFPPLESLKRKLIEEKAKQCD